MRTDNGMLIPLEVSPARLWTALSDPSHIWHVLASDNPRHVPVDGVMGRTLDVGDGGRSWRYLMRILDRDDDTHTVHVEVRARPFDGVGTTRILGDVRIRPDGRCATLVLTWCASTGTENTQGMSAVLRAVREEITDLLPLAARRVAGPFGLPALPDALPVGRARLLAAGAGAAIALIAAVLAARQLKGGRR